MIITVSPNPALAKKLAIETGLKPSTLHVTLAFLGSTEFVDDEDVDLCKEAIRETAPSRPIKYNIIGQSRFENVRRTTDAEGNMQDATHPTDVIFLEIESPELYAFREKLVSALDDKGVSYSKLHGSFKAHMSLVYVPHGMKIATPYEFPIEDYFDEISIWADPSPVFHYVLPGSFFTINSDIKGVPNA